MAKIFKVGDKVIVKNTAYCLSDSQKWFEYNHLNLLLYRYKRYDSLKIGLEATVIAKFKHHLSNTFMIYCIEALNGDIYLMSGYGLSS